MQILNIDKMQNTDNKNTDRIQTDNTDNTIQNTN